LILKKLLGTRVRRYSWQDIHHRIYSIDLLIGS
jgi:hypothetical protein